MIENNFNNFNALKFPEHTNNITPRLRIKLELLDELTDLINNNPSTVSLKITDKNFSVLGVPDNITLLKGLKYLQELKIKPISYYGSEKPVTFFGNQHCKVLVESCPNLKVLKIAKSDITPHSFSILAELKNLEKLDLRGNTQLKEYEILVEKSLTFPHVKELNFLGAGEIDDCYADGKSLISGLKSFANLEKLIFGGLFWSDEADVESFENLNWVSEDFSKSALDLLPHLPNLTKLEILNHYFLDLRSVVRVENLRNLTSLSIPSTIVQYSQFEYLATEEIIRESFIDLNKFVKLEELLLNFASDRYEFSTPSCQYLKELKDHPSLKTFTAYFGSFNFQEMEQIFHVAQGVNKITFKASEFIYDDYEPRMNQNITSLEIFNNELDSIQHEYYCQKIVDDQLCSVALGNSYNPLQEMNMASEILIRKSFDKLKLSAPHSVFGFKLFKEDGEITKEKNPYFKNFEEYLGISLPDYSDLVLPKETNRGSYPGAKEVKVNEFRRIGTTINFFPFSKFAPRLTELILSCPEENLEEEAFKEISKLPNLEKLVLGAGTNLQTVYNGIEEITKLIESKCIIFNPTITSRVKKPSLVEFGTKRPCEIEENPEAKKRCL